MWCTSDKAGLMKIPKFFVVSAIVLCTLVSFPVWAAQLSLSDLELYPCPINDAGAQPELSRPVGASCFVLSGIVNNPGRRTIADTDVFAKVLDAGDEPVLQNRTRVGSIGDVRPGSRAFALRLAIPAGTPEPFRVIGASARGFSGPVRSRLTDGDDLLPLERQVAGNS